MFNLSCWRVFLVFVLISFSDIAFGSLEKFETEYCTAIYDNISCVGNIKFNDLELLRSIEIEWSDKDISTQYVSFKILTEREFIEESEKEFTLVLLPAYLVPLLEIGGFSKNKVGDKLAYFSCYNNVYTVLKNFSRWCKTQEIDGAVFVSIDDISYTQPIPNIWGLGDFILGTARIFK